MLRSFIDIVGCAIRATDGNFGHVRDCCLDDQTWAVALLVVESGAWPASRRSLIAPNEIVRANWQQKLFHVGIGREQAGMIPASGTRSCNPHLRSCKAVTGFRIMATDGEIGHVDGLLVDEQSWSIGYLVVKTGQWRGGCQVLIAPRWIRDADWQESTVTVDLNRQTVREAPPYESIDQARLRSEAGLRRRSFFQDQRST